MSRPRVAACRATTHEARSRGLLLGAMSHTRAATDATMATAGNANASRKLKLLVGSSFAAVPVMMRAGTSTASCDDAASTRRPPERAGAHRAPRTPTLCSGVSAAKCRRTSIMVANEVV